jgi:hypothetical protein
MPWKLFEMAENSGGIGGEDVAGKATDGLIGFQKFGMGAGDGFFVRGYDAVIAAGERASPRFVRPELFIVLEDLARQREKGLECFALRQSGGFEHLHACLFESENQSGGESSRSVVKRLFFGGDVQRHAAEGTRDGAGDADSGGVAFDGENFAFERRGADAIERLQRMHGSGECSEGAHGFQDAGVASTTGVENNFSAQLLSPDAG